MVSLTDLIKRGARGLKVFGPFINRRVKQPPVILLLAAAAGGIVYFAAIGRLSNLCSPDVLRPILAIGVFCGLVVFVICGSAGAAFLRVLVCLGAMGWLTSWLCWKAPPPMEMIGQVVGWVLMTGLIWSLDDSSCQNNDSSDKEPE
jgi:hypothetical protein